MDKKRQIYTLPDSMLPEVKAVTFAKCSRSPDSFSEIANELTEKKSSKFHKKWVVGYGHSSVAEHAVVSLAMENISILATKVIEDSRLASYTEKSTRYQIFNRDRMYKPERIMNSKFKEDYIGIIDELLNTYEGLTEPMIEFMKDKYPCKEKSKKVYRSKCKARACDNIRYLLPTATLTNVGVTINARELEHLIKKLLSHPLKEMQEIGEEVKEEATKSVPVLVRHAEKNPYRIETYKSLEKTASEKLPKKHKNDSSVEIVDHEEDAENKLVASLLYPHTQLSYKTIKNKVDKMKEKEKEEIVNDSLKRRKKYNAPIRELEHIYYTFDIMLDYGAFRDIQRHRMCTQTNQNLSVKLGYDLPPEIAKAGFEKEFRKVMKKAINVHQTIAEKFPKEAQYMIPLAFRKRVLITWNLRELHHFISLRSGKKGHPSYRRIAQECWRKLNEIHPLLAKYIRVDMDDMSESWAASLHDKRFYYNPWAARKKNQN